MAEPAKNGTTNGGKQRPDTEEESKETSRWSYRLVVIMLSILAALIVLIALLPLGLFILKTSTITSPTSGDVMAYSDKLIEYSKWTLSILVGAFGAWIGAGAAYFFGKENMRESSRSTESALRIQQQGLRRTPFIERIKDMTLTAMNPNFMFSMDSKAQDVTEALNRFFRGYWFVPVVDKATRVLQDIIHAKAFWSANIPISPGTTIQDVVTAMSGISDLKSLHGESFFIKVSPDDKISDILDLLNTKGAEVAIVVDEKGKPMHCVTKTELRTFLNISD